MIYRRAPPPSDRFIVYTFIVSTASRVCISALRNKDSWVRVPRTYTRMTRMRACTRALCLDAACKSSPKRSGRAAADGAVLNILITDMELISRLIEGVVALDATRSNGID